MENNKKALEVFDLFASMKKVLGLLRDFQRSQTQNDLEAAILIFVKFHDEVTQAMIVDRLKVPKQTVSYTICELLKEGSIVTRSDPRDKRQKILGLTDKGYAYARESLRPLMALHERVFDDIGLEKIRDMKDDLDYLGQIIEEKTRREDG